MRHFMFSLLATVLFGFSATAVDTHVLGPDSKPQPGVPKGEVSGPFEWISEIYPGTVRDYWIYVPAQYDASKPTCFSVIQDGIGRARDWKLPEVFDNLIHKKEIPVMIGVFVNHGQVPPENGDGQPQFNRSFEYDAMGDRYARFLIEEIIPEVKKSYNLSDDPNDRMIGGASSGAIAAFNAAWERPDQFRRVFSAIGTYVGLRGGNEFPVLVRETEPKPIRVYLQDGSNDLNIYAGDWWTANRDMLSSLEWAGYDVNHSWGDGGHSGQHSAAITPDVLRWLWRDYPEPIQAGADGAKRRMDLLIPGEGWELVSEGHEFTGGPIANDRGEVFFTDLRASKIFKVAVDGEVSLFAEDTGNANGLTFAADGRLYACANGKKQIVAYDGFGNSEIVIEDVNGNDCTATDVGGYFTDPTNKRVYRVDETGLPQIADQGIEFPNGLVLSPDRTRLWVSDTRGKFVYIFTIAEDGTLKFKQEYGHLHVPYDSTESGADGMTIDTKGRVYVATHMGIQVMDPLGRVNLIIEKPQRAWLSNVTFGGKNLDTLYVTCSDKVFKRKINAKGLLSWRDVVQPPKPGL